VNELLALTIKPLERLYVERKASMSQSFPGDIRVFAEISEVEHFCILEQSGRGSKRWPNCLTVKQLML